MKHDFCCQICKRDSLQPLAFLAVFPFGVSSVRTSHILEIKFDYSEADDEVCMNKGLKVQQQEAFERGTTNQSQS